jgi:hypothetical protein
MGLKVVKQNKGMEPIIMPISFAPLSFFMVMEPEPATMEETKDTRELEQDGNIFYLQQAKRPKITKAFHFGGVKLTNAPFLVLNSFLFPERLHCDYIYFHWSYLYNYYNYLEPCALNAEFQHFIPRFNKISLLWEPH